MRLGNLPPPASVASSCITFRTVGNVYSRIGNPTAVRDHRTNASRGARTETVLRRSLKRGWLPSKMESPQSPLPVGRLLSSWQLQPLYARSLRGGMKFCLSRSSLGRCRRQYRREASICYSYLALSQKLTYPYSTALYGGVR